MEFMYWICGLTTMLCVIQSFRIHLFHKSLDATQNIVIYVGKKTGVLKDPIIKIDEKSKH